MQIEFDRQQLFEALNHHMVCTFSSTWGRNYSIARTEDRHKAVNDLIDRLFLPVLERLEDPFNPKAENGGKGHLFERINFTMPDDPEVTDEHRRAHF